ncbi:ubiquitin carboxyl-terminal hydrolase [Aspergillus egyptiacus]|nr:ubiquitin carboxyl-terminal hydrolase [Aspergillus egyptiacus]
MSGRVKLRRLNAPTENTDQTSDPYRSTSGEEKGSWNGFCELESEPALFNVMLREFGVAGVKVQEVVSLDDELLACLNKPVYGLIFLFRWREDDPDKQEASCPEGLWFANQTASNACASVALLNIVNNIEEVDLGENLKSFKEFTMPFTPALRGDAINNFEFVKRIHNSFARKMDILNSDLQLKYEAGSRRNKSNKRGRDDHEADAGFHFIAFVPALGKVWKFDGLERQPQALGEFKSDSDWLDLVKPNIQARMEEYEEDQIEFSVLSLTRDPLPDLSEKLALNIRHLKAIEKAMTSHEQARNDGGAPATDPLPEDTLMAADPSYGVDEAAIDRASVSAVTEQEYLQCSKDELARHRTVLRNAQIELRRTIREEMQSQQADDDYAAGRRYDYGPAIRTWLRFLARKRVIEDLIPNSKKS